MKPITEDYTKHVCTFNVFFLYTKKYHHCFEPFQDVCFNLCFSLVVHLPPTDAFKYNKIASVGEGWRCVLAKANIYFAVPPHILCSHFASMTVSLHSMKVILLADCLPSLSTVQFTGQTKNSEANGKILISIRLVFKTVCFSQGKGKRTLR